MNETTTRQTKRNRTAVQRKKIDVDAEPQALETGSAPQEGIQEQEENKIGFDVTAASSTSNVAANIENVEDPRFAEPALVAPESNDARTEAEPSTDSASRISRLQMQPPEALTMIRNHPWASAMVFASMVLRSKGIARGLVIGLGIATYALSRLHNEDAPNPA